MPGDNGAKCNAGVRRPEYAEFEFGLFAVIALQLLARLQVVLGGVENVLHYQACLQNRILQPFIIPADNTNMNKVLRAAQVVKARLDRVEGNGAAVGKVQLSSHNFV